MRQNKKTVFIVFLLKVFLKIALLGWILLSSNKCAAQSSNKLLRQGNRFYNNEKYNNATESYSKALQKAPKDVRANFNQGDAYFKLNELDKAKDQYAAAARLTGNTDIQAKAFYNIGNTWYKQEKYEESAKAYKTSLKLNPKDQEAKYNLMMALSKIKKNGGGEKNNQKDKQDKKQDKNQQQNNPQQNEKNNPQQQQGQQDKQQQQKQQQQGQMSLEEAQKRLDDIANDETKVEQKLIRDKNKPQSSKVQKDW
ncbi:MAG: batC [Bacteroidota bacterium]|nr:batC [Bacteroidota bacterium]